MCGLNPTVDILLTVSVPGHPSYFSVTQCTRHQRNDSVASENNPRKTPEIITPLANIQLQTETLPAERTILLFLLNQKRLAERPWPVVLLHNTELMKLSQR